jgi:hypothetical protein
LMGEPNIYLSTFSFLLTCWSPFVGIDPFIHLLGVLLHLKQPCGRHTHLFIIGRMHPNYPIHPLGGNNQWGETLKHNPAIRLSQRDLFPFST